MSVTPEHFLKFAEKALGSPDASEFDFRNAASRAYYAAFHCCLAEKSRGSSNISSEIKGSHDRLYARFESLDQTVSEDNRKLKSMAYMAKIMKSVRHEADYYLSETFAKYNATQQISDAKKVIGHWKSIGS